MPTDIKQLLPTNIRQALLGANSPSAGNVYATMADLAGASGWSLNGNTVGVLSYIGTNDNFDFPIYTNGIQRAVVLKTGEVGINHLTPIAALDIIGSGATSATMNFRTKGTGALYNIESFDNGTVQFGNNGFAGVGYRVYVLSNDSGSFPGGMLIDNPRTAGASYGLTINVNGNKAADNYGLYLDVSNPSGVANAIYVTNGSLIVNTGNTMLGGTTILADTRLVSRGIDATAANYSFRAQNSGTNIFVVRNDGVTGLGNSASTGIRLFITGLGATNATWGLVTSNGVTYGLIVDDSNSASIGVALGAGNILAKLHVKGAGSTSATYAFLAQNSGASNLFSIADDGSIGIGTSTVVAGALINMMSTTQGVIFPSQTQAQVNTLAGIASASTLVYNNTSTKYNYFNGTNMVPLDNGQCLFDHYADANNTNAAETDLYSDSILASTIKANGDKIIAQYVVNTVINLATDPIIKVYFAGNLIYDGTAASVGTGASVLQLVIDVTIIKSGANTARSIVKIQASNLDVVVVLDAQQNDLAGITFTNANTLKITGQGGASNEVTAKMGFVNLKIAA